VGEVDALLLADLTCPVKHRYQESLDMWHYGNITALSFFGVLTPHRKSIYMV
jgi:hypothetical protein